MAQKCRESRRAHHIPEHVGAGVGAGWVVKEAGDVIEERWAHVARVSTVGEVVLGQVAGDSVEESVDVIWQHGGSGVGGGILCNQLGNLCVEHRDLGAEVGLQKIPQ